MKANSAVSEMAKAWQMRLAPAERRALLATGLMVLVGAAPLARIGTPLTRSMALGLLVACLLALAGHAWLQHYRAKRPERLTRRLVAAIDRPLSRKLSRAMALLDTAQRDAPRVSLELAELNLRRIVESIPAPILEARASKRAVRWRFFSISVVLCSLGFALGAPLRILEGYNVFFARGGVAPLAMQFVELMPVTVQPPAYLRSPAEVVEFDSLSSQPRGSVLSLYAIPLRSDLQMVLTDGTREVPLVSDGRGGLTARYRLESSVHLRVAARFGNVLAFQRSSLGLEAVVDQPPAIELEGAPRKVTLGDEPDFTLRYRASDDHGIQKVELQLRAGSREERRQLVRLDGRTRTYEGAHVLDASDTFLNNSYGSVELRVVARDENTEEGAGWGQSEAIVLEKPSLGQLQVRRYEAYRALRDQLVDWLALVLSGREAPDALERQRAATLARLADIESGAHQEAFLRKLMGSFLRAQRDKLKRAPKEGPRLVALLEEVTLSVDSAMDAISQRDASHVARLLADVASEIEASAKVALGGEQRDQGIQRIVAASDLLGRGSRELVRLGRLGADLGEIARAGWSRIGNAFEARDYSNVERAAAFLAERLRRPTPSFMGGGRPGVESMGGGGARSSRPKASEADAHLERVVNEIERLAREHATGIEVVERLVGDADRGIAPDAMKAAAKQHADELRRLVEGLPALGAEPGTLRAALGLGKELVRGAADSLERLQLTQAHDGLSKADAALGEAAMHGAASSFASDEWKPKAVEEMRRKLAQHRDWLKGMLDEARQTNSAKDRGTLQQAAAREREMAERASRLARREAKNDGVLPEEVRADLEQSSRLMQRASDSLDTGRAELALEHQRVAQRLLEQNLLGADPERKNSERGQRPDRAPNGNQKSGSAPVVSTSDAQAREEFRRRVQKGLSRDVTPELSPAVRRYAEGLLK